MGIKNSQQLLHKNTFLFLLIFLIGIIGFVVYINDSFDTHQERHTFIDNTTQEASSRS